MELDDAEVILSKAEFFDICNEEQRKLLAFTCEWRRFEDGELLFTKGDPADGAYVLVSGALKATEGEGKVQSTRDVTDQGSMVGELALVLGRPRRATITSVGKVETLFVPRIAYLRLLRQYPELALLVAERIKREMGDYIRALDAVRHKITDGLRTS